MPRVSTSVLAKGTIAFTIESRLLRELGERLVKQPEVAVVELVKNAYDADARECSITFEPGTAITVTDDGTGMTLTTFRDGWMRIGTSAKQGTPISGGYGRKITGEKGIGRFAVRFLGRTLHLESVAHDAERGHRTRLVADFDWMKFDEYEDLGEIRVPYTLTRVAESVPTGTVLVIGGLRPQAQVVDLQRVRSDSIGVLTPLQSLFQPMSKTRSGAARPVADPGFRLVVQLGEDGEEEDVAAKILDSFVLRAVLELNGSKLDLKVYRQGRAEPDVAISGRFENDIGPVRADIRFFPRRKGVFANTPVDGRRAYSWVGEHAGVAVYDRDFRVQPYGSSYDDWLGLAADTARNARDPRSTIAHLYFPMSPEVRGDTSENWMLRLPQPAQLVGIVQVEGRRQGREADATGLVASADREGFVANDAFSQLQDLVRGAVEAIAESDRRLQREQAEADRADQLRRVRDEAQAAIKEVQASSTMGAAEKARIVSAIAHTQEIAEQHEAGARERVRQLEVMSLLGVVAGYMSHEFGTALQELKEARAELEVLGKEIPRLGEAGRSLEKHVETLTDYVTYASGYVRGSSASPAKPYPARPRVQQVVRTFGGYASDRHIDVEISIERDLIAPMVPASLYNGVALNLYTNALKAITARSGRDPRVIAFRAWNEGQSHFLEVSDTGIGIPPTLRERVFDPLFTTTGSRNDPLGSGMGLGLALVRRVVEAFGGRVEVVDPPPDFVTCVRVRLPLSGVE